MLPVRRKASPITGISPSTGMPSRPRSWRSLIMPPRSTVWPLATDTVELTRRCEIVGVSVSESVPETELISCSMLRLIVPSAVMRAQHVEDHARVAELDVVDDRGVRIRHRLRGTGHDRDLVAHLKAGRLVVDHDHRRR